MSRSYAYVNGSLVPGAKATVSVFDRGFVLGDGLFETLRAVDGHPEFLREHYRRLSGSARRLMIRLPVPCAELGRIIGRVCKKSGIADAMVRITLTRGRYLGSLAIDPAVAPTLVVWAIPAHPVSPALLARGVKVAVSSVSKAAASGADPGVKTTNYLANILAKHEGQKKGCYESILLDPGGKIAELTTSSFFCVIGGKVITPPIATGILPGITRGKVLEALRRKGIPFAEAPISLKMIPRMDEAFLTSSVRGVVPIVQIDKSKVGGGAPGKTTIYIAEIYQQLAAKSRNS